MRPFPLCALLALLPTVGRAATLSVGAGQPYATIGDAVEAAAPGDRIEIAAGAYVDDVQIDFDLELVGLGGSLATTWTGTLGRVPLRITGGATVIVEGLALSPRGASGIAVFQAALVASDVRVSGADVTGANGGAIVADRAELTLDGCVLDGNATDQAGGHLYAVDSVVTLTATDLQGGSAQTGAAVHVERTDLTITGGAISGNEAAEEGGALYVLDGALVVDGATFDANVAEASSGGWGSTGDAGAISLRGASTYSLIGATFEGNTSVSTAGAVRIDDDATGTIDGCTFTSNTADYGGAVYLGADARLDVVGSTFRTNAAVAGNGGAIRTRAPGPGQALSLTGSIFEGNAATAFGGALATTSESGGQVGAVTIDGGAFTGNLAQDGGALSLANLASVEIARTTFCANLAEGDGGAVRVSNAGSALHRYTNSAFLENEGGGAGGGLFLSGASPAEIFNDTFLANRAGAGGGMNLTDTEAEVVNTLVAYSPAGSGMMTPDAAPGAVSVTWSLFWDNSPVNLPAALAGGTGNQIVDPGLVAFTADGDCANDEPWPAPGSPLIDAGDPAVSDPDGSRSDIGAWGGPGADWDVFVDEDQDGFLAAVDCDDTDPAVNPGAAEVCNGIDDDCDGGVDDDAVDATTFYQDADGDGAGVEGLPVRACEPGDALAAEAGDCDDANAAIRPGAEETCNAIDDDCDGRIDEEVVPSWFPDADGDGWGADAGPIAQCDPPEGHVERAGDCDDADAAVNPGAEDLPGDGLDTDCDGVDGTATDGGPEGLRISSGCACDQSGGPGPAAGFAGLLGLLALRRRR